MTDQLRQAAQQALHELEGIPIYRKYGVRISNAITALRTALAMHQVSEFAQAQEQAEPVAFDEFLESQDYYELMQTYRHFPTDAHKPFEAVKKALRAAHGIKEQT